MTAAAEDRVLVIGAGVAGLAAAQALRAAGREVLVLEARARIGGRLWTSQAWPDLPVDLGATWIHGVEGNPVAALARRAGLETRPCDYDNAVLFDSDGQRLGERDWDSIEALEYVLANAGPRELAQPSPETESGSLMDRIAATFDLASLNPVEARRLWFLISSVIEHEYAADAEELSRLHWDESPDLPGGDVVFPRGYGQILAPLSQGLDIRLNSPVTALRLTPGGVEAETAQGAIQAAAAVVALPIGVLKAGALRFEPGLPESKRKALAGLGAGLLNKCVLRFPRVFWDEGAEMINHIPEKRGHWAEFLNGAFYGSGPVLHGFNAGRFGREIEDWDDAAIVADAMAVLRRAYGAAIPEPLGWQVTRWASDPWALGAYSYTAVGGGAGDRAALAAPLEGRLFFAGEACSPDHPATVHGALGSGQAAAQALLES